MNLNEFQNENENELKKIVNETFKLLIIVCSFSLRSFSLRPRLERFVRRFERFDSIHE